MHIKFFLIKKNLQIMGRQAAAAPSSHNVNGQFMLLKKNIHSAASDVIIPLSG
jgi:hypothetical protein